MICRQWRRRAAKSGHGGHNVNVKIPVTNTKGEFTGPVIRALAKAGIQVNVTAVFTLEQVRKIAAVLLPDVGAIVSLFAGRLADTGVDPVPVMRQAKAALDGHPKAELLWASPREVLNVVHADQAGTDIITVTPDILSKLSLFGKVRRSIQPGDRANVPQRRAIRKLQHSHVGRGRRLT